MKKWLSRLVERKQSWSAVAGILLFSFLMALLMNLTWGDIPSDVEVGKIAHQDIRADKDYEIIDEEATNKLRDEARKKFTKSIQKDDSQSDLLLNEEELQNLEERVLADVKQVIIKIQAGESIIRNGDRFEPRHIKILEGIRKKKAQLFGRSRILGTFLFVVLLSGVFFFVFQRNSVKSKIDFKDFCFQGALLLILIVLERSLIFTSGAVRGVLPFEISQSAFYALVPVASGAMMVSLVLPFSMALFFAPLGAVFAGLILQGSLSYTLYYLVGSVVGMQWIRKVRTRGQIFKVGLDLGLLNMLTLITLDLLNMTSVTGVLSFQDMVIRLSLAFLGGLMVAVTILILLPVFETLFNYLTPIKLLEYGSLNHPLLREMIVKAPGTYHHSHMVGTLAEAACEAIGADSLFARVASYFHDIGKMKKSPYFIENQPQGEDRHAILSPSMSALIVSSHVKDGIELASEYKLPERIIDIIPQHQGTKLISYFFNKAKEVEQKDLHVVDEREYRYPGPKPQTKEAGVILLADTVEAATRALKDRSPARLEEVVRNMINKNFIDGQLDECELTLKDLHTIANSFVRILMGIYHQRIEYPPDAQDKEVKEVKEVEEVKEVSQTREVQAGIPNADKYRQSKPLSEDSLRAASEVSSKNIRRLGS